MTEQLSNVQGKVPTPVTNHQVDQTNGKQCTCHIQPTKESSNQGAQATRGQGINLHTEYEGPNNSGGKNFHEEKDNNRNGPQEYKIIRILPDEEVDFMDLVRDSVSAQARTGPKPMFVNNYFVGDNNWRTVTREKPNAMRHVDESRNRSSTAVQTAISFLG